MEKKTFLLIALILIENFEKIDFFKVLNMF